MAEVSKEKAHIEGLKTNSRVLLVWKGVLSLPVHSRPLTEMLCAHLCLQNWGALVLLWKISQLSQNSQYSCIKMFPSALPWH